jgi:biopolymer transport protein ExbD
MAEIIQNEGGGKKKGKRRPKKHSTHIDMTPMVDLACLLLTFFMLTTAFSKPKVMEIVLPPKNNDNPPKIANPLNIIMDENDRIFWYVGMADPTKPMPTVYETSYGKDGIRKILLEKNRTLFKKIAAFENDIITGKISMPNDSVKATIKRMGKEDKTGSVVLIKATEKAKYGNMVDIVDELNICNYIRYTLVELTDPEKRLLDEIKKTSSPQ